MQPDIPEQAVVLMHAPPKPPRRWPAVLALAFLAPLTAEVLSNSTPVLAFVTSPLTVLYFIAFYGAAAVLIREAVRRRGLGWVSVLVLGAAYGILEEGLVVTSWFNPYWPDVCASTASGATGLCDYSRVAGTNLVWALTLTLYHAVVSITIPMLLTERMFPRIAADPWLRGVGRWGCGAALAFSSLIGVIGFGFLAYRDKGYTHPPAVPYLLAATLAVSLVVIGLRLRPPAPVWLPPDAPGRRMRKPPRLWTLRIAGFVAILLYFLVPSWLHSGNVAVPLALLILAVLATLAVVRTRAWSRRPGWTDRHALALASGVLGFFVVFWDPLLEVLGGVNGKVTRGTTIVALVFLILLIWLAIKTRRALPSRALTADAAAGAIPPALDPPAVSHPVGPPYNRK